MIDYNFINNLAGESSDTNEYLLSLYNIPKQMGAKVIVEIGCGRSTFALVAAARETGGKVYGIDIGGWDTLNRVPNGGEIIEEEGRDYFTLYCHNSIDLPMPWRLPIDFLHLDSGHSYELTTKEIDYWFPWVVGGGVIAMHDTAHKSGEAMGVRKALDEYLEMNPDNFTVVPLLDTKHIGMSILTRLWAV